MTNQTEDRNPVEVLGEEFLERRRRGEQATVQEYAIAHPALAAEIRRLFPTMLAMEHFKSSKFLSSAGDSIEMDMEGLEQLGDYRIIREIGRGGMGVVFEAEQQSLGRRVAVKVFPRQTLRDSRQLQRFHREARTAASLHHTNIVQVFGVGEQDGLHYFVMQRIEGFTLEEWIRGAVSPPDLPVISAAGLPANLPVGSGAETVGNAAPGTHRLFGSLPASTSDFGSPKRLTKEAPGNGRANALNPEPDHKPLGQRRIHSRWVASVGVQVAEAMAYAHSQGILHRDIKPGNLIVDARGTVWVTDFGLATILETGPQNKSVEVAGTLRFMAPEHLRGEEDSRSDIYSLGLTLYELLTLQPAFNEESRTRLVEKIVNGEVATPRSLRPGIPKDLEAIVLKSIARDPQHRYQNAELMAADLHRFIEGRPVLARPVGPLGRLRRWSRRSPAIASLSAALLIVFLASFLLVGAKWREAVAESHRAEDNLSLALASMDKILNRFATSWMSHPSATEGQDGEATAGIELQMAVSPYNIAVLQDALRFYNQFAEGNATNPQLQRDTAKAHRRVGDIYDRLGRYREAEQAYRRSLSILDSQPSGQDATVEAARASTVNQLGLTMYATSRFPEAEVEFRVAKNILVQPPCREDWDCQAELARTLINLGQTLWMMQRGDDAMQSHLQAVEILEKLVAQQPYSADYRLALARAYRVYYPFSVSGRWQDDHERIRDAGIEILEKLVSEFPGVPDYQYELSEMLTTTSERPRGFRGKDAPPEQLRRANDLAQKLCQAYPSIPRYRALLARTHRELGQALRNDSRDEAEEHLIASIEIFRSLASEFADVPSYHLFLSMGLSEQAESLRRHERIGDSRVLLQESIDEQKIYMGFRPNSHFGKSMLAHLYDQLARTLTALDEVKEAEKAKQESDRLRDGSGSRRRPRS